MKWDKARRMLRLGAPRDGQRLLGPTGTVQVGADPLASVRSASVCVASGKGGTGKSVVTASLARLLARRGRTLIVDADLGVGNAHILQDVHPLRTVVDLIDGERDARDVVVSCGEQLDLLPGGSGYARLAGLSPFELHLLASGLERIELEYRYLMVDSAAGISNQTVSFAAAADVVLLVTTPDVTAMTDAYAFLKVLLQRNPGSRPLLVVNRVVCERDGVDAAERIREVSRKFLDREPRWVGCLPEDPAAFESVQRRQPVVRARPSSPLAVALTDLAMALFEELDRQHPAGLGRTLLRRVGYVPARA